MVWSELCFLHWPIEPRRLRPMIPAGLELDLFEGQAWLALVPFGMEMYGHRFLEFNVRTYVRDRSHSGVWFFSLDCNSRFAVRSARSLFHLPYFDARMSSRWEQGWCHYQCHRPGHAFEARYRPTGPIFRSQPGSLEEWLTERYWLYSVEASGKIHKARVYHPPWPLQPGEVLDGNWDVGYALDGPPPSVLYSHDIRVGSEWLQPAVV